MESAVRVAVVRRPRRGEAVREALALIADDIHPLLSREVLVKPNLVSHKSQLPSTHADTLTATLSTLFDEGARSALVAEGASDASAGFHRFGYHAATSGLPVRFFDINKHETNWGSLELTSIEGEPLHARLSRTITNASFRVSLALAKTHVTSIVTLGLKNMLSSVHPNDRLMMHGLAGGGNGYTGWRRLAVEFLKQDNALVRALTRLLGRIRNARNDWRRGRRGSDPFHALSPAELGFLKTVEAMNRNLVALAEQTLPHLSIVDGFVGMHREGPRHGTPIRLGTVIAGTDAVAVDAVASAVMGFNPRAIGYLSYAHAAGLGEIELDAIEIVGDSISSVRKRFVPHSNYEVQRHWNRLGGANGLPPRFALDGRRRSAAW
jgi:uncharacterized protein (DUF362 family)